MLLKRRELDQQSPTIDRLLKLGCLRGPLKKLFGLGGLESDQDFVSVLTVCPLCCVMMVGWCDNASVCWVENSIR